MNSGLFTYDQLPTNQAKDRARNWWIGDGDATDLDAIIGDFAEIAGILGLSLASNQVKLVGGGTRDEPAVYYDVSFSQGSGASFIGWWSFKEGSQDAIREHAPKDEKLHAIADALKAACVFDPHPGWVAAKPLILTTRITMPNGYYVHSNMMHFEVTFVDEDNEEVVPSSSVQAIIHNLKALANWLHEQLCDEVMYQTSEEVVAEALSGVDALFHESGSFACYAHQVVDKAA
jgi:hypothetical protein